MKLICIGVLLSLVLNSYAAIAGPYLLWGHKKVENLQPQALVDATEEQLMQLFKDAKAIVIFVRNSTKRLESVYYPHFERLIDANAWTYMPQRHWAVEPDNYNANIEIMNLSGDSKQDDADIVANYNDALAIYGNGQVLGILAGHEEERQLKPKHYMKREVNAENEEDSTRAATTTPTPASEETEQSYVYVAEGNKAVLYVNAPLVLRLPNETIKLVEHNKHITFDDQHAKGYGRLSITFKHNNDKCILRFKFSLERGTWYMRNVEVDYKEYKGVLPAVGDDYTQPSAPLGFSYRCSAEDMIFTNKNESLKLIDYQVQPWLNGKKRFGEVYDCVGFSSAPILTGLLMVAFLIGILTLGISAMLSMHTPNRFENSRNKQLTFTVQE